MTEIEIYGTGRKGFIPSSWDEMNAVQVQGVFRIFDECMRKGASTLEFTIRILYFLLNLKPSRRVFKRTVIFFILNFSQFVHMRPCCICVEAVIAFSRYKLASIGYTGRSIDL